LLSTAQPTIAKKVVRTEYIKSDKCDYKCAKIYNTCDCNDRIKKLNIKLDEVKEQMKDYDGEKKVGFGKYSGYKWINMMDNKQCKSWCDWYVKNCINNDDFYKYIVLLKEMNDLEHKIYRIKNPYLD
jgi:hypothetical protein